MVDAGLITLTAFISPFKDDRDMVRSLFDSKQFIEIFCKASLATCESRDPKGLYEKARSGQIPNFTGISSPYEEPLHPELILNSETQDVETLTIQVIQFLIQRDLVNIS